MSKWQREARAPRNDLSRRLQGAIQRRVLSKVLVLTVDAQLTLVVSQRGSKAVDPTSDERKGVRSSHVVENDPATQESLDAIDIPRSNKIPETLAASSGSLR